MIRRICTALTLYAVMAAGSTAAAADADTTATTAAADTGTIQEVVVTARRFAEDLQNVPIAVTALSAATIETQDVTNLEDLNSFVPNFKIAADRATSSTINVYIRGVGQSDPLWGFDPGVGVYIDDVYLARPQTALLDVIDVQDLEVLRGPQGTLYGKNTIAGAIKYVTRDIDGPATPDRVGDRRQLRRARRKALLLDAGDRRSRLFRRGTRGPAAQRLRRSGRPAGNRAEPLQRSARMSRTRMCWRAAPTSRSSGARARSSSSSPTTSWITPMPRAASGSTTIWPRS